MSREIPLQDSAHLLSSLSDETTAQSWAWCEIRFSQPLPSDAVQKLQRALLSLACTNMTLTRTSLVVSLRYFQSSELVRWSADLGRLLDDVADATDVVVDSVEQYDNLVEVTVDADPRSGGEAAMMIALCAQAPEFGPVLFSATSGRRTWLVARSLVQRFVAEMRARAGG